MRCDQLENELGCFIDGELAPPERREVENHLSDCAACRGLVDKQQQVKKLLKQTLRELGQNYQGIAYYSSAADRYEQYATAYPKDKFSSEALNNAYLFRLGLGQNDKAQADLNKYEDIYKKKDISTAAKIFWSKHGLLKDETEQLAHARAYLATYGAKGGADRQAVAEAAVGQILWRNSCDKELLYDSCITIQRKKATAGEAARKKSEKLRKKTKKKKDALPKYCGTETQALITVHKRDAKKVTENVVKAM